MIFTYTSSKHFKKNYRTVRCTLWCPFQSRPLPWYSMAGASLAFPLPGHLTLCEAIARSTKLRNMQFYKNVFYQRKEAVLLITTLPCLKAFVSLIKRNKSKSLWHTEKFAKSRPKEQSPGRMCTKRQNHNGCSFLRCISSSPGH